MEYVTPKLTGFTNKVNRRTKYAAAENTTDLNVAHAQASISSTSLNKYEIINNGVGVNQEEMINRTSLQVVTYIHLFAFFCGMSTYFNKKTDIQFSKFRF